jgi:hypothetical protein
VSADTFLYTFTFLPLRVLYAIVCSAFMPFHYFFPERLKVRAWADSCRCTLHCSDHCNCIAMHCKCTARFTGRCISQQDRSPQPPTPINQRQVCDLTYPSSSLARARRAPPRPHTHSPLLPQLFRFHRTNLYDLMRGFILVTCSITLSNFGNMSRVYHYIRGQAMIKLYVIIAMLEILDKLCCSLGQDILDSLYWTTRRSPDKWLRLTADFCVTWCFVLVHAGLIFAHVVTLNVAINSSSSSMLTLLVSNNFAELKTTVFKKYSEQNLLQIACSDIVERFKLFLFLLMIGLQNFTSGWLKTDKELTNFVYTCVTIGISEVLVCASASASAVRPSVLCAPHCTRARLLLWV